MRTSLITGVAALMLAGAAAATDLRGRVDARNKYASTPFPVPGTAVSLYRDEGGQRVCVIDHGPGIPLEAAQRVFEKFQRGDGPGRPSGTGLGLAVSRGFVEAHGGWLELAPTPGGGATFCFVLPEAEQRGPRAVAESAALPAATGRLDDAGAPTGPAAAPPAAVQPGP